MGSTTICFSLWLSWCIVMFLSVYSEEEIVKDGNMSDWYDLAFLPVGFSTTGSGEIWEQRQQHVFTCGVHGREDKFWFITEYVNLNTTFTDGVRVDVEAELTLCDDPGSGSPTKKLCNSNNFEFYIYHGKYELKIASEPPVKVDIGNLLKDFTPLYNITNNTSPNATLKRSTQTFFFYKNNSKGVTFVVRSRGACGTIFRMKMYYHYCEETFINGTKFERTLSLLNGSKIVSGNCSDNSTENTPQSNGTHLISPKRYCYDTGTWSPPVGVNLACSCDKGFTPNKTDGSCSLCSSNSYKQRVSNDECTPCPRNAVGNVERTNCFCDKGFYNVTTLPLCYALPVVKNLSRRRSIRNGVTISWEIPDHSSIESIVYDVECFICHQVANQTRKRTGEQAINQTIQICNQTTNQIVNRTANNTICNTSCKNEQYHPKKNGLDQTSVVVSNLSPGEIYVFRVYARDSLIDDSSKEKWKYVETDPVEASLVPDPTAPPSVPTTDHGVTGPMRKSDSNEDGNLLKYIIIGIASLLLLISIVFLIIYLIRRKRHGRNERRNGYVNEGVELPDAGRRLYVDPSNYDHAEEAVLEFANELNPKSIFLERMIGGGAFGDVYKGELTKKDKKKIPIAVKTLKHDANEKSSRDFMLEASVMGQFDDPNVVRLEGVITKSTPRMIVLEYMVNGSLNNYLKSNDCMLTDLQLIGMARGVAAGMKYLSEINFVHRDLAARNVLVNEDLFCKIADFGLSRELEANESSRGEYSTSGGKIPVRWTAPEAVKFRKFSSASDVWSFGILLWEIMSFAERPYWEWDNFKVLEQVDEGFRLPQPHKCPKGVHDLMLHCWKAERKERPSFAQITIVIDGWIRSPETMEDEISALTKIGEWLTSLKMNSYEAKFVDAGYKRKSEIIELTDEDLQNIGVSLIGHRNKILKGINRLKSKKKTDSLPV